MVHRSLAMLGGAVIISGLAVAVSSPSYAQVGPFSCDANTLTTVVGANKIPVMRWRTNEFAGSGYNRVRRCMEVSSRFNQFYSTGQLNYITAGIVNGMPVVCATSAGGSCNGGNVLFTLNRRNRRNVAGILQTLFDNRAGAAGAVINESTQRLYIDVNKMLTDLGVDVKRPAQSTPDVPKNNPSTAPSGKVW